MKRKIIIISLGFLALVLAAAAIILFGNFPTKRPQTFPENTLPPATVYFTEEITPESLLAIYEALGVQAQGRVAVKISTGEAGGHHYLKPELIGPLVQTVGGTIVECNTAYPGRRNTTEEHLKVIEEHGFTSIAPVDIMDSEGEMLLPVADTTWISHDMVGSHLANYDFMINLAHFKGHAMGGFGGVLKNASIGVASANGKAYIHSAGLDDHAAWMMLKMPSGWFMSPERNDPFIESMASAAQAVHNFFATRSGIVYINVMNNLSVDCDCDAHPAAPLLKDRGIMASTDPVALDRACLDLVFNITPSEGDDNGPLIERIEARHGTHIIDHAHKIGLGTKHYKLVKLEK